MDNCIKKMDICTRKLDTFLEGVFEDKFLDLSIRDIAKKSGLSKSTIQNKIAELTKEGILAERRAFSASVYAKFFKTWYYINKIQSSGLVSFLVESYAPSSIILFGSFAKGESVATSDIDIFIESTKDSKVDFSKFEKKLKHEIHLFVNKDIKDLPDNLLNNVVNGVKLYGFFDVR